MARPTKWMSVSSIMSVLLLLAVMNVACVCEVFTWSHLCITSSGSLDIQGEIFLCCNAIFGFIIWQRKCPVHASRYFNAVPDWVPILFLSIIRLTPSFCRFFLSLSHLVPEILRSKVSLMFHQNVLFNRS